MEVQQSVGKVIGPGDAVAALPERGQVRLGAGLTTHGGQVVASKAGVLRQTKGGQIWLEGRQKRYIPAEGEVVVGTIIDRHSENFLVDIGAPFTALLPQLSFEGATRRNRPNLKSGDVVYARVVSASRDAEPQLSCVDALGRSSGYGQLKDGMLIDCSTALARQLLAAPAAPVLQALGTSGLQFEVAVGLNGRVWVSSPSTAATILVANTLQDCEWLTAQQVQTLVARRVAHVTGGQ